MQIIVRVLDKSRDDGRFNLAADRQILSSIYPPAINTVIRNCRMVINRVLVLRHMG